MIRAYFFFRRLFEYISYKLPPNPRKKIIALTFDDYVDEKSIELAEYLKSKGIRATFFLTVSQNKHEIIKRLAAMSHEIGGHSIDHSREERNACYSTAPLCRAELKKYTDKVVSWRFPWTSKNSKCLENIFNAGFKIDSSEGAFYPVKNLWIRGKLYEIPWLRLPRQWQMDVNENDYETIKNYILKSVASKNGTFVLGFHTYHQYKNFNEFKDLIEKLLKMQVTFLTLGESFEVLKNGSI